MFPQPTIAFAWSEPPHYKDHHDPGLACAAMRKAARKIDGLDTSAGTAEEQGNFAQALARLGAALAKSPPA